ncbi:phosphate transporter [Microthyrium microscopicum]|uniref:Phosphate transporter n=1 Tax=Microthyrium microscopicum TaxID=703497 RepID=A0A6A6U8Y0_9PEZI|nr:phosphate transporter [Microthyrium microscopicum]
MIDMRRSFNYRVWAVAASGFFTDSYNLFATNTTLPSIAYVFWPNELKTGRDTLINAMTILGSILGQIAFGYFADKYGRTRLYGLELIIVVFSTIGVASCSTGYSDMSVLGWLCVWRFVMGIGIGAEYPLSAVITSEWSATQQRGRMLASVFLMQPIGQIVSQIVGLGVLYGWHASNDLRTLCPTAAATQASNFNATAPNVIECTKSIDSTWRIVTGVGAAPAVIAIAFRFLIWDSGLYDLEVKRHGPRALANTARIYPEDPDTQQEFEIHNGVYANNEAIQYTQFSRADLYRFFIEEENYKYLVGTSACWFLLDFAFFGLGMGNPRTLAKLFANKPVPESYKQNPSWNVDAWHPENTIFDVLSKTAFQSLYVVSISSLAGSIFFIFFVNRFSRRKWLIWSFGILSILFIVAGATWKPLFEKKGRFFSIVLIALCHFAFNAGANTLTFMIPSEIFPTTYRSFCHGISAAAGKLGSVIVLAILNNIDAANPATFKQTAIFVSFGGVMALGALFAWLYIPNVQEIVREEGGIRRMENMTLENLGQGKIMAPRDDLPIGLRERVRRR